MKKFKHFIAASALAFGVSLSAGQKIVVDLSKQELKAIENGKVILKAPVSAGRYGYSTPNGGFKVLSKAKKNKSTLYPKRANGKHGGADMPYTIRLTNSGVAIHAGELPKANGKVYPDSHGCIRLPYDAAARLFDWTKIGTPVKIVGKTPYTDKRNTLRKQYGTKRLAKAAIAMPNLHEKPKVVNRYHDNYTEWGDPYYEDGYTAAVYTEGDLEYLDSL